MPSLTTEQTEWFAQTFERIVDNVERAVVGKREVIRLALVCLLTEGHLLLEDNPGTGKTLLAKALANSVQATSSRIQFTPDLLPSDVTGVMIYNRRSQDFEFRAGPIFASVVLADEINRASPKTQSALLEVMEEGRVTVEGTAHPVGAPFMVIATQNPLEAQGVYPLPEAQLDRFLMKTALGYPDREVMLDLLANASVRDRAAGVAPIIAKEAVIQMSAMADLVHVEHSILGYVTELAERSRRHPSVRVGVSVRGCLALVRCAKTRALAQGRAFVQPDDVKELAVPVLSHRLVLQAEALFEGTSPTALVTTLLDELHAPTGV